ncbi:dystonin-like [Alligator sinensis]|uniref:Dystonin-like n=1 Tax=Alligator sinensis TaxID=38654 RepID=A0A3Q0HDI7_ALLSI|nr:dystonin-like [Alligator sinensis]
MPRPRNAASPDPDPDPDPDPLQKLLAVEDTGIAGEGLEVPSPDLEEVEREWKRREWKEWRLDGGEQLLALRHWLDALEKRLPALPDGAPALEVTQRVVPFLEDAPGAEPAQDSLEKLLSWVTDMEDLVSNQKPPSSEVKVVKAQLQEQKLLKRLLEERRPRVERVLQDRQPPPEPDGHEGLAELQEKWAQLIQEAEARHGCLERILPAAQRFQESVDAFQEWLSATERHLARLWRANGCVSHVRDAHQQIQGLCEEIRPRLGELERALENGQRVLEMVTGEHVALDQRPGIPPFMGDGAQTPSLITGARGPPTLAGAGLPVPHGQGCKAVLWARTPGSALVCSGGAA